MNGEAGKGDRYRPVDREAFSKNYEEIYGDRPIRTWTPDPEDDPRKQVTPEPTDLRR